MIAVALALVAVQLAAPIPPAPIPPAAPAAVSVKPVVVLVDDRAVQDQAPPSVLSKLVSEFARRKSMRAVKLSDARKALGARSEKALSACGDDAGCLATAARELGADVVVVARLTKREGASFLALTRISALRPQITDDAATLAGSDADAVAFVPEGVEQLFPNVEVAP